MIEGIAKMVGDRILANLWSAGIEATTAQMSEIRAAGWRANVDHSDIDAGVEQAVRDHLVTMGFQTTGERSPRLLGVAEHAGKVPMPGDVIELLGEWSCVPAGGTLQMSGMGEADRYAIGRGRHYMDAGRVSMSTGGPASILRLPVSCLIATDRRAEAWFWRFRDGTPRANAGIDYVRSVRVWQWSGNDADFDSDRMSDAA